jgi:exopolyphosphatase/guanosine-5'-triphosphate,3'-diphosphate pyrophosphatase
VPHGERLLLGPGPSNPYPEAVAALTRPVLGHMDPEFLDLLDETMQRLRDVFRAKSSLTLPISGTGSAGMEACFVNLLEPGETAIVGVNGVFGERMAEVARRCGADVDGAGADATLRALDRRMRITRLGQGVDKARRLDPDAIARTLDALREYRGELDELGVKRVRATATSAARDSANREDFFGPATEVLGFEPELISGEEEARLSFLGATTGLEEPSPYLVVDIGGGSTEFIVGTHQPEGLLSVDMGSARVTEHYLASDPPAPEELSAAQSVVRDHLADVERELPAVRDAATLVGLAGTITTVAAIELGLAEYDRDKIHHYRIAKPAAEDVFRTLATETAEQRRHNPGLDPGRVDVIVGGALVLVTIMRAFGFDEMLVSEADILDGLVRSLTE